MANKICAGCGGEINPHSRYYEDAESWEYSHCLACRRKIKRKKRTIRHEKEEIRLSNFEEIKKLADEIYNIKIGALN